MGHLIPLPLQTVYHPSQRWNFVLLGEELPGASSLAPGLWSNCCGDFSGLLGGQGSRGIIRFFCSSLIERLRPQGVGLRNNRRH